MRRLIIRPGGIGDCILCLPAIEFLKTAYTEVWVPTPVVPLIRFADRVRSIPSTGIDLLGIPGVESPRRLREELESFDSVVSWYGANRPEFRDVLKADFHAALPTDESQHCADFFARQVGAPTPAIPSIGCIRDEGAYAIIQPFSGSARKNWPLGLYRELAQLLPMQPFWCAGPEEPLEGAVRFDNLYELACWLAGARVYIGNDSGITHLAAAAGTRVATIFGPTNPRVWAPRGRVRVIHDDFDKISVARVLDNISALLAS